MFAADATLTVDIYNETQINILYDNSRCSVSVDDITREVNIRCPTGVTYKEPTPETFTFAASELTGSIEVDSATIVVGKPYQISASGLSADGCNTTSATDQGTAETPTVTSNALGWSTTEMACVK